MLFYSIESLPIYGNGSAVSVGVTSGRCSPSNFPVCAVASPFAYTAKRPLLVMTSCAWGSKLVV